MKWKKVLKDGMRYLLFPDCRFLFNSARGMYRNWSDEKYLSKKFKLKMGQELDLDNPKTFNEKLQWLKIYNRKPEYTMMVDKYLVREYIANKIGEEYLIPLIGVWDNPNDIDFNSLPDQFVIKCNHNSGMGMYICKDKKRMNIPRVRAKLRKGYRQDFFLPGREWPYKDVPKKIVAEKYMEDKATGELRDYKIYCFGGEPKIIMISRNRQGVGQTYFDYYDTEFNWMDMTWGNPRSPQKGEKPERFEEMLDLARVVSAGIPHVRVDFYIANGQIYFGELTFFDGSGFEAIYPPKYDRIMGDWIELPKIEK